MKDLLTFIATSLVDHPEEIDVRETSGESGVTLVLRVAQSDMGKVIGKQGRIAKAIRTLMKSAATKDGIHVTVDIVD